MRTSLPSTNQPNTNVTGIHTPAIEVCQPETHAEVVDLVKQACEDRVPLFPISTGFNWGYGSTSTVLPGCRLIDLRKMRCIRNKGGQDAISRDHPVALIEPGVTQGDLYDYLESQDLPLTFNVTGSARDTSIIGNALDRGVGYFGPRREDLFALEVVLGNGKTIQTGFRRLGEDSPLACSHPYGLGPILDGLMFQGNYGIVTSACFRLAPRRPVEVAVSLALRDTSKLGEFIHELVQLKRDGLMTSVTHIANKARSQASLLYGMSTYLKRDCGSSDQLANQEALEAMRVVAPHEWTSLAAVTGNSGQVKSALKEIKQRMRKIARVMVVTDRLLNVGFSMCHTFRSIKKFRLNAAAISAIRPLHGLALGIPTDAAVDNLMWKFGRGGQPANSLDASDCGLLYVCPALPSNGHFITEFMKELELQAAGFGHTLYTTINVETPTSLVAVINLLFDRTSESETANAHACAKALFSRIRARGLEVYRSRADMMEYISSPTSTYWQTVRQLKRELDPHNIIAPGRYNLQ